MKLILPILFAIVALTVPLLGQTAPRLALNKGFPQFAEVMDVDLGNELVAVTTSSGLYIHKLETGEEIQALKEIKDFGPTLFAANKDLCVIGKAGVTIISAETLETKKLISVPELASYWMSADRTELFVTGMRVGKPTIWRIDTANGRARPVYTHSSGGGEAINHISLAPEKELALIGTASGERTLLKTGRRWASAKVLSGGDGQLVGILPNGNVAEVLRDGDRVKAFNLIDPLNNQLLTSLPYDLYKPKNPVLLPKYPDAPIIFKEAFDLLLIDPATGAIRKRISRKGLRPGAAGFYDRDRQLIMNTAKSQGSTTVTVDLDTAEFTAQLDNETFDISQVLGHPKEPIVYVSDRIGMTKIIRIENGRLKIRSKYIQSGDTLSINSTGTQVHMSIRGGGTGNDHSFETYDPDMRELMQSVKTRSAQNNRFYNLEYYTFSDSGDYCLISDQRNSRMIDRSGKVLWEKDSKTQSAYIDEAKQRVYIGSSAYDLKTGKLVTKTEETVSVSVHNQRADEMLAVEFKDFHARNSGTRKVQWFSALDGKKLREKTLYNHNYNNYTVSADGQMFAVSYDDRLIVYDSEGARVLATIDHEKVSSITTSSKLSFFNNNQSLVSIGRDGQLLFWDLIEQKFLATLQLFENDNEWLAYDETDRFDASAATQDKLKYAINLSLVPLSAYSENYFRPQLLRSLLNHDSIPEAELDLAALSAPPVIRLTAIDSEKQVIKATGATVASSQLILNAAGASNGSPITEFRIFQNGKRISTNTRGLSVVDDDEEEDTPNYDMNEQFAVSLLPGENTFSVVAVNAQRIESAPSQLIVNYSAPASQETTLHLLVIGVDSYENEEYNLNYAVADASAFKDKVEDQGAALFNSVKTTFIKDSEVTKALIKSKLAEIQSIAAPQDVFVFYYAGHGVVADQGKGDFFIVPSDVTQLYGADAKMAKGGLSSRELQDMSQSIAAQKQLFILDACQSAGALTSLSQRGAAEEKAIAQLARSTGTHWLTASGSQQFATEFADLGHGAFTYTLLNGLSGKADSGDGRVTVNELKAYLESEVPEVTAKYKGTAQYPASYGYGQDFPITLP